MAIRWSMGWCVLALAGGCGDSGTTGTGGAGAAMTATSSTTSAASGSTGTGMMITPRMCGDSILTAPLDVTITLTEQNSLASAPVPSMGATVDLIDRNDEHVVATATTMADGTAVVSVPAGTDFKTTEYRYSKTGFVTAYVDVAGGPRRNAGGDNLQSEAVHDGLAANGGTTWDPSNGIINVNFRTCPPPNTPSNPANGLGGATIEIQPSNGAPFYLDTNGIPSPTLTATVDKQGGATDYAVPPGPVKIFITHDGVTNEYDSTSRAGAIVQVFTFP